MMLVFLGGRVIDPSRDYDSIADVVVEGNRILQIAAGAAENISREEARIIDVNGCWVVPGLIDLHVHFREPGQEYKETIESGLKAAAAGGYVAVCPMPNTNPVNDTRAITEMMIARSHECNGPRLYPIAAITRGCKGEQLTEMADLKEAGAIGMSDDGHCVMDSSVMRSALEYARTFDLFVVQHCEDHQLTKSAQMHEGIVSTRLGLQGWPRAAEDIILSRDLILAEMTRARYHMAHVSSLNAVRLLRDAKKRGLSVSAEVTPHHLLLTDEALQDYNTALKVTPPLREMDDREALREALSDGTIDCIATDHAPHSAIEKECEFATAASGMIGLQTTIPLTLQLIREGILTPLRLIESLSTAPARIARLDGGVLREGGRADITIINPDIPWIVDENSLLSRSYNTPFLGQEVQGAAIMTVINGKVIYER